MKRFAVELTVQAVADIDRNATWWAENHSFEQAVRWAEEIRVQLSELVTFPESCLLAPENERFSYEVREKSVGFGSRPRYRALFTIRENVVTVIAVRAAEQDEISPDDVD